MTDPVSILFSFSIIYYKKMLISLVVLCATASLLTSLVVIKLSHSWFSWMLDHDTQGIQKFHHEPVPRLGGIAILVGLLCSLPIIPLDTQKILILLVLASVPVLAGGIVEDLTKKVSPMIRLLLAFASAIIGFYLLDDARAVHLGIPFVDNHLLIMAPVSLVITVLMIGGVSHAVNIIDGYNGLMPGFMLMLFAAMAYVSYQSGDLLMLQINLALCAVIIGFIGLNFPYGKMFSGDGGAYFLGYTAATLSLILVNRNDALSPWFALLLMIFPVWETLFSIGRRKFIHGTDITQPDDQHLHTLIFKHITQHRYRDPRLKNGMVSPIIWLFCCLTSLIPAIIFPGRTGILIFFIMVFIVAYYAFYRFLTKQNKQHD